VVLVEEAGCDKSSSPTKKVVQKTDTSSGKNVAHKMQVQLESLQKKINDINNTIQKYVYSSVAFSIPYALSFYILIISIIINKKILKAHSYYTTVRTYKVAQKSKPLSRIIIKLHLNSPLRLDMSSTSITKWAQ